MNNNSKSNKNYRYEKDKLLNSGDFNIKTNKYTAPNIMPSPHKHTHYEILYIPHGQKNICFNDSESCILNKNNIALVRPNLIHQTRTLNNPIHSKILINITADAMKKFSELYSTEIFLCFNSNIIELSDYESKLINYILTSLYSIDSTSFLYDERRNIYLAQLLSELSAIYVSKTDNTANIFSSKNDSVIASIVNYLQQHLQGENNLIEISKKFFISERQITRLFKSYLGTTPHKYLIQLRIIKAKELLENTNLPITAIASKCGINSPAAFSHLFNQVIGMSPKKYREKLNVPSELSKDGI